MNYDLSPTVSRLTAFTTQGGALAAADIRRTDLVARQAVPERPRLLPLSWPSRKSDAMEKVVPAGHHRRRRAAVAGPARGGESVPDALSR